MVIDTEHSPYNRSEVANLVNSFNLCQVAPIVRIPVPYSHYATMGLDAGAAGILAPYCESKSEVEEIVGAVKWKPLKGKLFLAFKSAISSSVKSLFGVFCLGEGGGGDLLLDFLLDLLVDLLVDFLIFPTKGKPLELLDLLLNFLLDLLLDLLL